MISTILSLSFKSSTAIRKRAGEAGLRISEYVRQAVVSAEVIPRLNRQDADTIRKLAGEANNINQLVLYLLHVFLLLGGILEIATNGSDFLCGEQSKVVSVYRNITLLSK